MSVLGDVFTEIEVPASSEALERTVSRLTGEGAAVTGRRPRLISRRIAIGLAVLLFAAFLAATPAGRSAVGWAADLVGIGEVGGPPTRISEVGTFDPASDQIVLATGQTADRVPFEIVAFRSDRSLEGTDGPFVCVNAEFPTLKSDRPGSCYSGALRYGAVCCSGLTLRDQASSVPRVEGEVSPDVDRVEISYVDTEGDSREVDAVVGMITPEFAKRLGVDNPSGLFLASLPDLAEQPSLPEPLEGPAHPIEVVTYGAGGQQLEAETVEPVSDSMIEQVEGFDRIREAHDEFNKECVPKFDSKPGPGAVVDADELTGRCRDLLDELSGQ